MYLHAHYNNFYRYTEDNTTEILEIISAELSDNGKYYCVATAADSNIVLHTSFFLTVACKSVYYQVTDNDLYYNIIARKILSVTANNTIAQFNEPANLTCSVKLKGNLDRDKELPVNITISRALGSSIER